MQLAEDLFKSFQNTLTPNFLAKSAEAIGMPPEKVKSGLLSVVPTILEAVEKNSSTPSGARQLEKMIHDGGYDLPSDPELQSSQISKGKDFLNQFLEGGAGSLVNKIASELGLSSSTAGKLLGLASSSVFAFIGSKLRSGGLNAITMSSLAKSATSSAWSPNLWYWVGGGLLCLALLWWGLASRGPTAVSVTPPDLTAPIVPPVASVTTELTGIAKEFSDFLVGPGGSAFIVRETYSPGASTLSISGQSDVDSLAQVLLANPATRIRIEGHTDSLGGSDLNQRLSLERAQAFRDALVVKGVAEERVEVAGLGEARPVGDNNTAEGRSQNRRVEIWIQN